MSRPQIIRADTLDLQDHDAPSAKDHTRQPTHPAPLGVGAPSPHQAGAIKQAEEQSAEQQSHMPPLSDERVNGEYSVFHEERRSFDDLVDEQAQPAHQQLQNRQDQQAVQQNGGFSGSAAEEVDMADGESDDGLDDDMMDKISSSPSIDDGGYSLPLPWPTRADSLTPNSTPSFMSPDSWSSTHENSSSPFLSKPAHFPLFYSQHQESDSPSPGHHLQGGYSGRPGNFTHDHELEDGSQDLSLSTSEQNLSLFRKELNEDLDDYDKDFEMAPMSSILLPTDDPSLGNNPEDNTSPPSPSFSSSSSDSSWLSDEGYHGDNYEDDAEDISFSDDLRFTDSGWGGECLREVEDIDFEFVYALHTFVATVEGQANATKGDTMVLLDDSNSYWWLVRVQKDSSIGYLPAEHIETPTERLARLNKHRNIDLSATMLGDNPEKSKNPLKKAMRRRNAKTVQFSAPTYVEASDVEYSSEEEEEEGGGEFYGNGEEPVQVRDDQQEDQDKISAVEPLDVKVQGQEKTTEVHDPANGASERNEMDGKEDLDIARTSDEMLDRQIDGASPMSRHGVVRNTDSFFKDDNVETRKITLTPNLLRDDSSNSTPRTSESKELKPRGSLDNLEKSVSAPDRTREEKKKKERKTGMLSGLFKRKDKKTRAELDDTEDLEKPSNETLRDSPQSKGSDESSSLELHNPQSSPKSGKLQKQPPGKLNTSRGHPNAQVPPSKQSSMSQTPAPNQIAPIDASDRPTMRLVESTNEPSNGTRPTPLGVRQPEQQPIRSVSPVAKDTNESTGMFAPITNMLRSSPSTSDHSPKPEKVKKAKTRVELDDFDSSPDVEQPPDPLRFMPGAGTEEDLTSTRERLSESPVQVSPAEASTARPPSLMGDTSSQEEPSISPISPPSSPELIDRNEAHTAKTYEGTPNSMTQSSSATPTWSDASLRLYLEDGRDIRDLLVVVHDKTGVVPAGPDHPITGKLFVEENKKLAELSSRLDGVLGDWLARKSKTAAR